ncbi:CYP749A22 protein [Hibiscus syriacus]|uniref:CYP749A22 protein n=1 Tax=Hibiscus syriacus TaxID=106335 RepID=A0A6A2ZH50_HIBSY|nr:CYP749A22 protein [Hibiscus syriacus]
MDTMGKLLLFSTASFCLYFLVAFFYIFYKYWWIPRRIQSILNSQGIRGPPYEFVHGNNKQVVQLQREASSKPLGLSHDIFPRVMPHFHHWINKYGKIHLGWNGVRAQLEIAEPELVKEVLRNSDKAFPKREPTYFFEKMLGDGLASTEREKWSRQRKLANYAFHGESLKNMTPAIIASVETMMEKWRGKEGEEIEVYREFRLFASEVISRTAFGSSYLEGEKIFDILMKLSGIAGRNLYKTRIPIIRQIWKSADEIETEKLAKTIHDTVMKIVRKREEKVVTGEAENFGHDFLGLLVNAYHESDEKNRLSEQDLVDECKTFYFAGHETTNSLLAWTFLLLATHTDWQDKARTEVFEVFGNRNPDLEGIAKLKIINMIINETLRLYPPVSGTIRKVRREVRLGKLALPTPLEVDIRIIALHHDPDLWGPDVHLFKPERFVEGVAKATNYNAAAYLPFGLGPRSCVGMSFAITETKIALSMILQRYSFTLSPAYVHSPVPRLVLKPEHGLQLLFHSLHADA